MVNQDQLNAEANTVKSTVTKINELETGEPAQVQTKYYHKAIPSVIKFSSRASVKITHKGQDHYYTVEYGEERQINNFDDIDISKERQFLIDDCNNIVDNQIKEIVETFLR